MPHSVDAVVATGRAGYVLYRALVNTSIYMHVATFRLVTFTFHLHLSTFLRIIGDFLLNNGVKVEE